MASCTDIAKKCFECLHRKVCKDFGYGCRNWLNYKNKSDFEEVKHGKWEKVGVWGDTGSVNYRCTVCKETTYNSNLFVRCPKCGAKMDGEITDFEDIIDVE